MKSTYSILGPYHTVHEYASTLQSHDVHIYQTFPPIVGDMIKHTYTRNIIIFIQVLPVTSLILTGNR